LGILKTNKYSKGKNFIETEMATAIDLTNKKSQEVKEGIMTRNNAKNKTEKANVLRKEEKEKENKKEKEEKQEEREKEEEREEEEKRIEEEKEEEEKKKEEEDKKEELEKKEKEKLEKEFEEQFGKFREFEETSSQELATPSHLWKRGNKNNQFGVSETPIKTQIPDTTPINYSTNRMKFHERDLNKRKFSEGVFTPFTPMECNNFTNKNLKEVDGESKVEEIEIDDSGSETQDDNEIKPKIKISPKTQPKFDISKVKRKLLDFSQLEHQNSNKKQKNSKFERKGEVDETEDEMQNRKFKTIGLTENCNTYYPNFQGGFKMEYLYSPQDLIDIHYTDEAVIFKSYLTKIYIRSELQAAKAGLLEKAIDFWPPKCMFGSFEMLFYEVKCPDVHNSRFYLLVVSSNNRIYKTFIIHHHDLKSILPGPAIHSMMPIIKSSKQSFLEGSDFYSSPMIYGFEEQDVEIEFLKSVKLQLKSCQNLPDVENNIKIHYHEGAKYFELKINNLTFSSMEDFEFFSS